MRKELLCNWVKRVSILKRVKIKFLKRNNY